MHLKHPLLSKTSGRFPCVARGDQNEYILDQKGIEKKEKNHYIVMSNWKVFLPYIYASRVSLNTEITRTLDNNRQKRD